MSHDAKKEPTFKIPEVKPGDWRGEILGGCTVNFGQVVQPGPPRRSVEFTYAIMPAAFATPEVRFTWPGVIMVMAPTPMKTEFPDAGLLFKVEHLPSLHLSLQVTRGQFSDMLRMLEAKRLRDLHFTVEDGANGAWPVFSWGVSVGLA
ncbi:hypothetical protein [Bradyrhizobium iriomotense]|uniref:hypothetical protein n=1 Tax=Bradyrhizobium iriomotense TaxID=441950 RepID=UPI001B89F941|nr:hypothetical protein [Bradyrhizobium iriomotense]MBR1129487.1 hypothetical protein [Bradyrhizobium iriomotense]